MHTLEIRKPVQLLQTLVEVFQRDTTVLELTGGLSQLDAHLLENVTIITWPHTTYTAAEIPLTQKNVQSLAKSILPRVGIRRNVYEISIAQTDEPDHPLFFSYDNFSPTAEIEGRNNKWAKWALVTSAISVDVLDELVEDQIIRRYVIADPH